MKNKLLLSIFLFYVFNLSSQDKEQSQEHTSHTIRQLKFYLIGASYEFPVQKNISVAPFVSTGFRFNRFNLGVQGNYYFDNLFNLSDKWDVYGSALAYYSFSVINNNDESPISAALRAGGRWFWNDKWGLYYEFGINNRISHSGAIGVTLKLQ